MRFCAEKCTAKMPHSAPAETLHDILRLHGTQAVLALCVVVRAQFCREPCEKIMNIYIANCTIMSYLLGICRFTPALLIFMKFSKHSGENSWCEKSADFQGMEGMDARKSVTAAKNQQALFRNRENVVKRHLPCSDDFLNGILTRRCKIREIICIKCCLEYGISTR